MAVRFWPISALKKLVLGGERPLEIGQVVTG
jgi:hypothetical protein